MSRISEPAAEKAVRFTHAATPHPVSPRLVLWAVVCAEVCALALPLHPFLRTVLGFMALAPLIWLASNLEPAQTSARRDAWERVRRFRRLRTLTQVFLEEVRRLNWLGVDARRGGHLALQAEREMQAIETRLHELIGQIRTAAGVENERRSSEAQAGR
ncbi:MAG: hypothetical protein R3E98_07250 [Gemmatimonadota bacterium]|nr:hypothetical protein [Gemmatimonadota bacterium]